jgi:DNA-directed RNA polymerase specialized sigma24 family protein
VSVDLALFYRLRRIVAAMEPHLREVFLLSCVAERSYVEIAEWLGISIADVEERLADAIVVLARGLQEESER